MRCPAAAFAAICLPMEKLDAYLRSRETHGTSNSTRVPYSLLCEPSSARLTLQIK
jgi:hypothetical protein